jgi:four helix bundle protein
MDQPNPKRLEKPYDIHERLLLFACELVKAVQFLHTRGAIASALSSQILSAGMSIGANAAEADGASSIDDFIAKFRIALKEAKETWFRLCVCRRCNLVDTRFDPLISESEELVRIIAAIVHSAERRKELKRANGSHKPRRKRTV